MHSVLIRKKVAWLSFLTTFQHILQLRDHFRYHKHLHLGKKDGKYTETVDVNLLQSIALCAEFPKGEECSELCSMVFIHYFNTSN